MQSERRRQIVEMVQESGSVTVTALCEVFDVSAMTIRRDLRELDQEGSLRRLHGGAVGGLGRSYEAPYPLRSTRNAEQKRAIAARAADLVLDGDSIALDVGTTTLEIARALNGKRNLTIITAGLRIAEAVMASLSLTSDVRLVLTGGILRPGELSMTGHIAERSYSEFHVDKAFIGVGGVSLDDGLTEVNLEDASVKQHLIRSAQQRIVVADSSKLGRTTLASVAPLSSIHTLITDADANANTVRLLRDAGVEVLIARDPSRQGARS